MKCGGTTTVWALRSGSLACWLAAALIPISTAAAINPYNAISERNIFDLRAPPPPPTGPPPEAKPPPNVKLKGLMTIFGKPQGIFAMQEPPGPGKPPGPENSFVLGEGERQGSLDVVSLDLVEKTAQVKIDENITTIHLEDIKSVAAASPPPAAFMGVGMRGAQSMMQPGGNQFQSGAVPPPGAAVSNPQFNSQVNPQAAAAAAANPNAYGAATGGAAANPLLNRQVRTDQQQPLSAQQQILLIEAQREQALKSGDSIATILPPTPLTPMVQQGVRDQMQQQSTTSSQTPTQNLPTWMGPRTRGTLAAPPVPH